jgi:hypothetical protein
LSADEVLLDAAFIFASAPVRHLPILKDKQLGRHLPC